MKYEIANQLGINLKQGYNGDLNFKRGRYIGGYMVKRMIQDVQNQMSGQPINPSNQVDNGYDKINR